MAKARVDNGFSQVGRTLKAGEAAPRVLMLLASRSIALANAAVLLAQNGQPNEALPLLRSLYELACAMLWVADDEPEKRAKAFLDEYKDPNWERLWPDARLKERMEAFAFPRELQERALMTAYDHLYANAHGLPWGHVFEQNGHKGVTADELLAAASFLMGNVVKSLDMRWPGKFSAAEWENTRG